MPQTLRLLAPLALTSLLLPLHADDVTDQLDAASAAYKAGNFTQAINSLDAANQFIRQKKAELVLLLLPAAPKGWEAGEPESEVAASAMLGGGVTVKRSYTRDSSTVTCKIQSDSAVLQYAAMFSNPMLLAASGAKMETLQGQTITLAFPSGATSGSLKAVVDNRYLVEVEGQEVTAEDLRTFAKALDFAKLTALR